MTRSLVLLLLFPCAAFAAPPMQLVFTTTPRPLGTGECSPPVTIQARYSTGAPIHADAVLGVTLGGAAGYFRAGDCSSDPTDPAGGVQIPKNGSDASFSFIVSKAGPATLTADVGSATAMQPWTVSPAAFPSAIAVASGATSLLPNVCSPQVTYTLRDGNGTPTSANRRIEVTFGPAEFVEYYSDPACSASQRVLLRVLLTGDQGGSLYVRTAVNGSVTLELTAPGLQSGLLHLPIEQPAGGGGCTTVSPGWAAAGVFLAFVRRRRKDRSAPCAS